jgi:Fur family ferric uptake transcriptional regulator
MLETEKIFKEYLGRNDYKLTAQRKVILKAAKELKGHFDADKLYHEAHHINKSVSRASVYRTIHLLLEAGFIIETTGNQSKTSYENVSEGSDHDHLICVKCGRIIEFKNDKISKLENEICQKYDFKPTERKMSIKGYCKKCQNKKD